VVSVGAPEGTQRVRQVASKAVTVKNELWSRTRVAGAPIPFQMIALLMGLTIQGETGNKKPITQ
jgi:hypothetical protein